jgi:23S rRNA (cytosine1962-C5)-methyltransferase
VFPTIVLKPGKDRKVRNFHPWVYRDEIDRFDRAVERMGPAGGIVQLDDTGGSAVAKGWYSPKARLAVRVLTRDVKEDLDAGFFLRRVEAARAIRDAALPGVEGVRAIHSEADELPGMVVDLYAGHAVLQLRYAGAEAFRTPLLEAIKRVWKPKSIFERSDMEGRREEGLEPVKGPLRGETPPEVEFREGPARFRAAIHTGHKTGFYLDQRENRDLIAGLVRPGMRVLDAFSSTGAFSVRAALAGAKVVAVEKDPAAAAMAGAHAALNGVTVDVRTGDAFQLLPSMSERFELAILDPPAIAKKKEEQSKARWGFVTLATAALRLLEPGGRLFVSSCAYHLSPTLLEETVRIAGGETGRRLRVRTETFQPADHPWVLQIPETLYLKSILVEAG